MSGWVSDSIWNQALGNDGNRLVITHDPELGTMAAVVGPDGEILSTGAATGRHVNHDCVYVPIIKDA